MEVTELVVSNPQADILETTSDIALFMCGVGSGKTFTIGVETADFIEAWPELVIIIAANTHSQLSTSTLKEVFKVWLAKKGWRQWNPKTEEGNYTVGKVPPPHFHRFTEPLKSYDNIISFDTGAMIITASLENYHALDGVEAFGAWLDETKDTKEEAVKEVVAARLRQPGLWKDASNTVYDKKDYARFFAKDEWYFRENNQGDRVLWDRVTNQQIFSYNPLKIFTSPAKVEWLNTWFGLTDMYEEISKKIFSKTEYFKYEDRHKCIVIASTYHNRENVSVDYIPGLLEKYKATPNLIDMLVFGSPIAKAGGEFVHQFKRLQHVKRVRYSPRLPVHFSFDFNVIPYMTGLCGQYIPPQNSIDGRGKFKIFREYCLASPKNKTAEVAAALPAEFGQLAGVFYYGDPSGKKRQTISKQYQNEYSVVEAELRPYMNNYSNRVQRAFPAVLTSRNFLNNVFAGVYNFDIEIDESCKNLIHDLEYAKEDENGGMLKPRVKDPITKQSYEKYGHCLDALRYMVVALFPNEYSTCK